MNHWNATKTGSWILASGLALLLWSTSLVWAQATADFRNQTIVDRNFAHEDLAGADFSGSVLNGVQFGRADLTGANFEGAVLGTGALGETDFTSSNLTNANFAKVRLSAPVSFEYAHITNANFSGVDLTNAIFGPSPSFNTNAPRPIFAGSLMTCEFPLVWSELNIEATDLPNCSNAPQSLERAPVNALPTEQGKLLPRGALHAPLHEFVPDQSYQRSESALVAAGQSIFVSPSGTDSATCGSSATAACETIATGITRCTALGTPCSVLVAYGKYNLKTPIAMADKVSLVGGYVGGKPTVYQSNIIAPPGGAPVITANAVTGTIQNMILLGTASTNPASPSLVMQVVGTNGVSLDTVDVQAGSGVDVGASGGGSSKNGVKGNDYNASSPGAGGANQCGSDASGGQAGTDFTTNASCSGNWSKGCHYHCSQGTGSSGGGSGAPGQSTGGAGSVFPGKVKYACSFGDANSPTPTAGKGGDGATASNQAQPASNRIGNFDASSGGWSPVPGATGQAGNDGGGGGGGGSGQPDVTKHCKLFESCHYDVYNAKGGGGGGSGGCGATGGGGGQMGGGTFGIVLVNSELAVGDKLKIVGAQGGKGGNGGSGAAGGTGGAGGAGCGGNCGGASQSGAGGAGGTGGNSGGGAGGNGGPSIGLVLIGNSTFNKGPTSIYPGASGAPGTGGDGGAGAPKGADGQSGLAQATYTVSP